MTYRGGLRIVEERTDSLSPVSERLTLLSVHAHPDDEASKGAPTVAKYHAAGVHAVLVCCTGGEEGELQNPALREEGQPLYGLSPEEEKAKVTAMRPAELAASAEVIGFDEVVMLGYRDSGMPDSEANHHPDSFHQADLDEATGRLVAIIRRTKPQVVITYGDDQRGYPHPDHLRVHDISVLAFERAGDAAWYPDAGEPFQPSKLYYSAWSRARMIAVHEALLRLRGESPFDEDWFKRPDVDHRITTRIDVSGFFWARTGALLAHATQVDPNARVLVRAHRRRARRDLRLGGLDPRPVVRRSDPRGRWRARPVRRHLSRGLDVSVQYRVVLGKKDERVEGPDDADVVVTAPFDVVSSEGFDATMEFMRGRVKASGTHGPVAGTVEVGRRDEPAQPARIASLSARYPINVAPCSASRRWQALVVGHQREIVDPLVRRRGQRVDLGSVDHGLHVDLRHARFQVGDRGVGTSPRPGSPVVVEMIGEHHALVGGELAERESRLLGGDGRREPDRQPELTRQLEVHVEELGPQRDRREVRGEVGRVDAPHDRALDLSARARGALRPDRRVPRGQPGCAGTHPRPRAMRGLA